MNSNDLTVPLSTDCDRYYQRVVTEGNAHREIDDCSRVPVGRLPAHTLTSNSSWDQKLLSSSLRARPSLDGFPSTVTGTSRR
ncbi:hypothetical protein RRG08_033073 [Elysia crispata]|uniref:Uncharacterized protein n=1 Tax=Elysia crispata TaxID=231223 RepID=A0AAE1DTT2_9GAST|nr:hypothetical protein RRG08_033073 [Elysia crispata]